MNEKKSLLEKLGLVVSEPDEPEKKPEKGEKRSEPFMVNSQPTAFNPKVTQSQVDLSNASSIDHVNVVELAYSTLPQSTEDIFVVEELLKGFTALPEQQRYLTLQSTLKTLGKDPDMFILEADSKRQAIAKALQTTIDKVTAESNQIAEEINAAKARIDELTQRDLDIKNGLDISKKECIQECKRLDNIILVLGGQIGGKE